MLTEIAGFQVVVEKKKIKNMYLRIKPPDGRLALSAPLHTGDEAIENFIKAKTSWIQKRREIMQSRPRQDEMKYITGETLRVWGNRYRLEVCGSNKSYSLSLNGDTALFAARKSCTVKQRESYIKEWYRDTLESEIIKRLPGWEAVTGLHCSGFQTKYMKTRWGTCNIKTGKIWLSLRLAQKPPVCLDYVILHELAHIKVPNHGKGFAAILDRYMPDWRDIKKQLDDITL